MNNPKVLQEQFEKDIRYFRVNNTYVPNYSNEGVTRKFYSKYDAMDLSQADPVIVHAIQMAKDKGPKDKYAWPATENQSYGWFAFELVPLERNDKRFYTPCASSNTTKHMIKLKMDQTMKLEKFAGIPFKLN